MIKAFKPHFLIKAHYRRIDFVLNGVLPNRTEQWLVPIAGLCYAANYYSLGRFLIRKLGLKTLGREDDVVVTDTYATIDDRAYYIIDALGGQNNLITVDACASRLRCGVKDSSLADENKLKELGAFGLVRLGSGGVQVIFGGKSQNIRDEINSIRQLK